MKLILIITFILGSLFGLSITKNSLANTETLCRQYASRSHEKEFAPSRYEAKKDLIDSFDWYNACLENIKEPVAK